DWRSCIVASVANSIAFPSRCSRRRLVWNGKQFGRAKQRVTADQELRPSQLRTSGLCPQKPPWPCAWCRRKNHGSSRSEGSSVDPNLDAASGLMNRQLEKAGPIIRALPWDAAKSSRDDLLNREWLVTNGLGGYGSGTISGTVTRRYHGLLIAALPAPLGRVVMWSYVSEFLRFGNKDVVSLGAEERAGELDLPGADFLREFRLEDGLPVWTYHVRGIVLEKRVVLPHLQNTVHVSYRVLAGGTRPRLELRPAFHFRHHEASVDAGATGPYKLTSLGDRYEIAAPRGLGLPPLRMKLCECHSAFTISAKKIPQVFYRSEQSRGYAHEGNLWSPGFFHVDLEESDSAALVGSTEN